MKKGEVGPPQQFAQHHHRAGGQHQKTQTYETFVPGRRIDTKNKKTKTEGRQDYRREQNETQKIKKLKTDCVPKVKQR